MQNNNGYGTCINSKMHGLLSSCYLFKLFLGVVDHYYNK